MYANDFRSPKNRDLCEMVALIAYKFNAVWCFLQCANSRNESRSTSENVLTKLSRYPACAHHAPVRLPFIQFKSICIV